MGDKTVIGTPPLLFLPAKNYKFNVNDENYIIRVPRKGNYKDLDPNFFTEEDGSFNILDVDTNTLYLPSITKVLFACNKYPYLEDNQFFVPYVINFDEEEVLITGQIISLFIEEEVVVDDKKITEDIIEV